MSKILLHFSLKFLCARLYRMLCVLHVLIFLFFKSWNKLCGRNLPIHNFCPHSSTLLVRPFTLVTSCAVLCLSFPKHTFLSCTHSTVTWFWKFSWLFNVFFGNYLLFEENGDFGYCQILIVVKFCVHIGQHLRYISGFPQSVMCFVAFVNVISVVCEV